MQNSKIKSFKQLITVLGVMCFILAITQIRIEVITLTFLCLAAFTIVFASKMNLSLPRSTHFMTFSDSLIFLTFLIYGGESAIILASLETLLNCLYLKSKGTKFNYLMIPFNFGVSAISTSIGYFLLIILDQNFKPQNTVDLITQLGILAISQFLVASFILSLYSTLHSTPKFFSTWKEHILSASMTYIVGAGLAGIIFKLISYADFWATSITMLAFALGYFAYRKSISELNTTIEQAEIAEREKLETEKLRAEQAEKHVEELSILIEEQDKIGAALLESKEAFRYAAMHDALTQMPNRQNLLEKINFQMKLKSSDCSDGFFVLYVNINRFKHINDTFGRNIGDNFLKAISERLQSVIQTKDFVARLGGDKFAIILTDTNSIEVATKFAKKCLQKLSNTFSVSRQRIQTKFSVSLVPFTDQKTPEEILLDADFTIRYAKEKDFSLAVFDKNLRAKFLNKIKLEADLSQALKKKEFVIYYQPIISLKSGRIIGFEALLRWISKERGFTSPADFIPVAEETGQIIPITIWLLQETTKQLKQWQNLSTETADLMVSVNISGKHLSDDNLIKVVKNAVNKVNLEPSTLKLEITESSAMEDATKTVHILKKLKELGVQLSIDDFGTGYSSLSQLQKLPFDTLKIDRSFVMDIGENRENSEILNSIIALAKSLHLRIIAEGIETESQLALLTDLNCDYGQGYHFAKPMPLADIDQAFLEKEFTLPNRIKMPELQIVDLIDVSNQHDSQLSIY